MVKQTHGFLKKKKKIQTKTQYAQPILSNGKATTDIRNLT